MAEFVAEVIPKRTIHKRLCSLALQHAHWLRSIRKVEALAGDPMIAEQFQRGLMGFSPQVAAEGGARVGYG
jgi:hypothetical protein